MNTIMEEASRRDRLEYDDDERTMRVRRRATRRAMRRVRKRATRRAMRRASRRETAAERRQRCYYSWR